MTMRARLSELFAVDVRALAVFRMALGTLLLVDLLTRALDLEAHYTDRGVLPARMLYARWWEPGYWSVHLLDGGLAWQAGLFAVAAGLAVALAVGFHTRWVALGSWVLLCSLHTRQPIVLQSGDTLLRMLLFWGLFLPLGSVWSVDRWRRRADPAPVTRVMWLGTVALLLQTCLVYWFIVLIRLSTPSWLNGGALYWALQVDAYVLPLGRWLAQVPALLPPLTTAVMLVEGLGPFLAFVPWRTDRFRLATVALFVAMHLAFGATLSIGLFWAISITSWLVFLPTSFFDAVERRLPSLTTGVQPGCSGSPSVVATAFVGVCLAMVLAWNVRSLEIHHPQLQVTRYVPNAWNVAPQLLRLDQYWAMYSPPPRTDGFVIAEATLDDGTMVDLLTGGPVDRSAADIAGHYPRQRWRKFLFQLATPRMALARPGLAEHLRRRWDEDHPSGPKVLRLRLIWMMQRSRRGPPEPMTERVLGDYPSAP